MPSRPKRSPTSEKSVSSYRASIINRPAGQVTGEEPRMRRFSGIALGSCLTVLAAFDAGHLLAAGQAADAPTYYRDVLPILQKNCQSCHRPGQIAPFSMLSYESTRPWARSIKTKVESRQMPPVVCRPARSGVLEQPVAERRAGLDDRQVGRRRRDQPATPRTRRNRFSGPRTDGPSSRITSSKAWTTRCRRTRPKK